MLDAVDLDKISNLLNKALAWCGDYFWSVDMLIQAVWIALGYIVSNIIYRLSIRNRLEEKIDAAELPIRVKRALMNLKRLIMHTIALGLIFVSTQIASSTIAIDTTISSIVMKLMLAWIMLRACLQFIENTAVRNAFTLTIWSIAALSIFGVLDETHDILDAIGFSIGNFRLSALLIINGCLSIFALLYFALFISTFMERRILKSKSLTRSSQVLMAKITRIALIVTALLIGITSTGIDLSVFAVFSGAIGLGVGFGLQKVVSNLFSGLLLLMDKSITPGDVIELENSGTFGWVNHMGARYTEIITRDNKSFLIPNEEFITQRVVNWSHGNSLVRIEVPFGVHYKSNPHDVLKIAAAAATTPERVVETPEPVCYITEFADSSINFTVRFWIKDAEAGITNVKGAVLLALWDAFKEHNIEIPYPHRELYIHETK